MERAISKDWNGGNVNYKLLIDTAVLAGKIMLSSGAETYRVEDTMCHILKTSKCESIEVLALMTGIVATINGEKLERPVTSMTAINDRSTNLNNVIKVNAISRKYCGGEITLDEAYAQLNKVEEMLYNPIISNVAMAIVVTGFAMMFGGSVIDVVAATLMGAWLAGCTSASKVININAVLLDVISCIGIAILTMTVKAYIMPELNLDIVIVSSIMPIVPGVAITNAIRDTLQGDYLSGCARILEAFLKASSIALGIGVGMAIGGVIL